MFTGKAGSVRWSATVDAEVRYQIKRLSHHASIALWDACNECKVRDRRFTHHPSVTRPVCTRQIFYPWWKPVLPTVAAVDKSRPIWPASPSNGWVSGVERLTSRPTGSRLAANSHWRAPGVGGYPWAQESHGPYTGFMRAAHASAPSADRCFVSERFVGRTGWVNNWTIPHAEAHTVQTGGMGGGNNPMAVPSWTGPGYEGWGKSEFGANSWPSFESISPQLPRDQMSLGSAAAAHRNWNVSVILDAFFGRRSAVGMR